MVSFIFKWSFQVGILSYHFRFFVFGVTSWVKCAEFGLYVWKMSMMLLMTLFDSLYGDVVHASSMIFLLKWYSILGSALINWIGTGIYKKGMLHLSVSSKDFFSSFHWILFLDFSMHGTTCVSNGMWEQ